MNDLEHLLEKDVRAEQCGTSDLGLYLNFLVKNLFFAVLVLFQQAGLLVEDQLVEVELWLRILFLLGFEFRLEFL